MIRGTTAQYKFKLSCTKAELAWATINLWQSNNPSSLLPVVKTLDDCYDPDDSTELHITLTEEETARFSDKYKAKLQFRAQHKDSGHVFGNEKPELITVYPMFDHNEIIIPGVDGDDLIIFDGKAIGGDSK
jgi:hypothetical protein